MTATSDELSFFDQQVSEVFNPRKNRWELKKGKRNEVLDTHVLATAASQHPELYLHKWKAADWKRRRAMVEPESIAGPVAAPEEEPTQTSRPAAPKKSKPPFFPPIPKYPGW